MSNETWDDEQTSKRPEQVSFFLIKKENKFLTFIVYIYIANDNNSNGTFRYWTW